MKVGRMRVNKQTYQYSDDETLDKAVKLIKNGSSEEEVRKNFNLTDDDMDLIDFVIEEF